MFSLESPHRGDSNKYIQYTIINIKMEITRNYPKYNYVCSYGILFLLGTQERVRNSRGKRVISVRATEVRLYLYLLSELSSPLLSSVRHMCLSVSTSSVSRLSTDLLI